MNTALIDGINKCVKEEYNTYQPLSFNKKFILSSLFRDLF